MKIILVKIMRNDEIKNSDDEIKGERTFCIILCYTSTISLQTA